MLIPNDRIYIFLVSVNAMINALMSVFVEKIQYS